MQKRHLTEKELDFLESKIPELAQMAGAKAFYSTLASGYPAFIMENGVFIRCYPDGREEIVGKP